MTTVDRYTPLSVALFEYLETYNHSGSDELERIHSELMDLIDAATITLEGDDE